MKRLVILGLLASCASDGAGVAVPDPVVMTVDLTTSSAPHDGGPATLIHGCGGTSFSLACEAGSGGPVLTADPSVIITPPLHGDPNGVGYYELTTAQLYPGVPVSVTWGGLTATVTISLDHDTSVTVFDQPDGTSSCCGNQLQLHSRIK